MVHYKLYYFPVRNLGEAIRMTLQYVGVQYEDFRIPCKLFFEQFKGFLE
jgi:hypothetical protein